MTASWGGYTLIINLIPIFTVGAIIIGKFNTNLYISYTVFYILGTLYSLIIPFVQYPVIHSSEHL